MRRVVMLCVILLGLQFTGASVQAQPPSSLFLRRPTPAGAFGVRGPQAALVATDRTALSAFRQARGGRLVLPLADGSDLTLALQAFDVLAPGAVVTVTGERGPLPFTPDFTAFQGRVEGEAGSLVVLGMTSGQVTGMIERPGHNRLLITPRSARGTEHFIAEEPPLPAGTPPFVCPAEELPRVAPDAPAGLPLLPADVQVNLNRLSAAIALDLDNEFLFNKEGGDTTRAINYALLMLATSSAIYERDINVTLRASYVNVWVAADPYSATDLSGALNEFTNWWNANRGTVTRDAAQLVSGRGLGGGIAWLSTLCNLGYAYSVVGSLSGNENFPTNTTTWDIDVMAHELGHTFSSRHTHSCWWQSNGYTPPGTLLDSCYTTSGESTPCYSGPTGRVPADKGTIMSYCQLAGAIANTVRLDFHTACRTVMRYMAETSCLGPTTVQPPRNVTVTPDGGGAALAWTASPTAGVTGYDVYRSLFQLDTNPLRLGSTAGLTFRDAALGTFYYKLKAVRAADTSAFSGEVKATLCAPAAAVPYNAHATPLGVVAADLNEDGILDLATANFGSDDVSILAGQGTGGAGDGTFAAAVNYALPAGSFPTALAAGDLNGDGILDLAVACQEASSVALLLGQGTGGVPDGTFAAGPVLATNASPAGVVIGDFNEDGIGDLAVSCTAGGVSVLLGNGTGGLGDGTFAPRVNYTAGSGPRGLTAGDFNEDGIPDLVIAGGSGATVLLGLGTGGRGDGTFAAPVSYPAGALSYGIATGDFDADGIRDLVVANSSSGTVSVLRGQGTGGVGDGTFAAKADYPCGTGGYAVGTADWSGDGIADILVANNLTGGTVTVLTGRSSGGVPNGTFDGPQSFGAGASPRWLAAGDFNADGVADLAVANAQTSGKVSILKGSCVIAQTPGITLLEPNGGQAWYATTEHVLRWSKGRGVFGVNLEVSRDGGVNWQTVAANLTDTTFVWTVTEPATSDARVRVHDALVQGRADASDSSFTIYPAAGLGVPATTPHATLSLGGVRPNPARGAVRVWFTLADARPASLELMDLAGRRVRSLDLARLGPGSHSADLEGLGSLRPGLYLVRLSQSGRSATGKLVLTR